MSAVRIWLVGLSRLAACASVLGVVACGGATSSGEGGAAPSAGESADPIARIHHAKCGSCHLRVEPGQRTRAELEEALGRHHRRVRLTDEQWAKMVDYLAAPEPPPAAAP